jgi:hypothetical protein
MADSIGGLSLPYCNKWTTFSGDKEKLYMPCVVCTFLICLAYSGSLLSLLGVAIERYIKIIHPFLYNRWISKEKALSIITALWIYPIILSLPFFKWNICKADGNLKCYRIVQAQDLQLYIDLGSMGGCTCAVVFLYAKVFYIAWPQQKLIRSMEMEVSQEHVPEGIITKEETKIKMMGLVIGILLISWTPFFIISVVERAMNPFYMSPVLHPDTGRVVLHIFWELSFLLLYSNSFMNSVIYDLNSHEFRSAFRKILHLSSGQACH